jgi:hypothetical protein
MTQHILNEMNGCPNGGTLVNIPNWLKPGLFGAVVGAAALTVVGFAWGGWVTGSTAEKMASEQAQREVLAALVPICVEQSNQDPEVAQTLALLKDTSRYQRNDMLMKTGWATMPGSSDPDRDVASACMRVLAAQF